VQDDVILKLSYHSDEADQRLNVELQDRTTLCCDVHLTSLVNLSSPQKNNNIFKLEVSFMLPSLGAPLSRRVDGIVGQTNILSNPPFHVDHSDAKMQHH
jgi:hypothetical protein